MRAFVPLTLVLCGLSHTPLVLAKGDPGLATQGSGRQLSNISLDVVSLSAALAGFVFLLLLIPPFIAFVTELFRRIFGGGGGGGYDKVDDSGYSYDDYDTGYSRQSR